MYTGVSLVAFSKLFSYTISLARSIKNDTERSRSHQTPRTQVASGPASAS